jgi:hypothetical protein
MVEMSYIVKVMCTICTQEKKHVSFRLYGDRAKPFLNYLTKTR